ncbi:MAG TPA: UDP-N-acetylmuramate--L-alanine ligase [Rectinemataceae bacterium]|nr:UDP-N-acetylmuramate--L-alanine ligase [Rectinemataceae bacterium]
MITAPKMGDLRGKKVFLVGAKGTGMTALAEIMAARGAILEGSDVADTFYTDAILASIGLRLSVGFDAGALPADCDLVIHSAAYSRDTNPQLLAALARGIPVLVYPEALGALSRLQPSAGIAGVHGKTTTTALAGSIARGIGLEATVIAGSAVSSFGGRSTMIAGDRFLIAETCEYRRHFLNFSPGRIILTSVEPDHQDYYPSYSDIAKAFEEYIGLLPHGGTLVWCADDEGADDVAHRAFAARPDLRSLPYGEKAHGPFRLLSYAATEGRAAFRLAGIPRDFELRIPGKHIALDAIAALALCLDIAGEGGSAIFSDRIVLDGAAKAIADFAGSKRRSEILGEAGGIVFLDDYGHHPTAIARTIEGIRTFWPSRRLVVDFMSHTYSRTKALLDEFAASLDGADEVVVHGIYASARERPDPEVSGEILADKIRARSATARHGGRVSFFEKPLGAKSILASSLAEGDLFLTMGAGDNWKLGEALLAEKKAAEAIP